MINREDIEAGDKCYTRDGGCLIAYESNGNVGLAGYVAKLGWTESGKFINDGIENPLDIIRIEKAPKPVVEEVWLGIGKEMNPKILSFSPCDRDDWNKIIKLVFANGVWDKEKSEQLK